MNALRITLIATVSCLLLGAGILFAVRVLLPGVAILGVSSNEYSRVPSPDGKKEIVFVERIPGVLADGRVQCYLVRTGENPVEANLFCSVLGTYDKFLSGKWVDLQAIEVRVSRVDKRFEKRKTSFKIKDDKGEEYINIRYDERSSP